MGEPAATTEPQWINRDHIDEKTFPKIKKVKKRKKRDKNKKRL